MITPRNLRCCDIIRLTTGFVSNSFVFTSSQKTHVTKLRWLGVLLPQTSGLGTRGCTTQVVELFEFTSYDNCNFYCYALSLPNSRRRRRRDLFHDHGKLIRRRTNCYPRCGWPWMVFCLMGGEPPGMLRCVRHFCRTSGSNCTC
jgi:hypothetical protein